MSWNHSLPTVACLPTVRLRIMKLSKPPFKFVSESTWFLVPQQSAQFFLYMLRRTSVCVCLCVCAYAFYSLCIYIARFSSHKLSFCMSVCMQCLVPQHHDLRGGGESKDLRLSLTITVIQIKNNNVFTRVEICNAGQL